jgi:hypothetical protein
MDADGLHALAEHHTVAEIATILGVHPATARKQLRKLGVKTARMRALRDNAAARISGVETVARTCPAHGRQDFRLYGGAFRCPRCNVERVGDRRRALKEILVREAGGACELCGYDRCLRALEFHHRDPSEKAFGIGRGGHTRSLERARAEAAKCVLLCSNCHMEVEDGMRPLDLPAEGPEQHTVRGSSIGRAAPC